MNDPMKPTVKCQTYPPVDAASEAAAIVRENREVAVRSSNTNSKIGGLSHVDNFLTWLTSPLEIDVIGGESNNEKNNTDAATQRRQRELEEIRRRRLEQSKSAQSKSDAKMTTRLTTRPQPHRTNSQQPQPQRRIIVNDSSNSKLNLDGTLKRNRNTATKATMKNTRKPQSKRNTIDQDAQRQQHRQQQQQKKKDGEEKNAAEQFLNWLTTPPDLPKHQQQRLQRQQLQKKKPDVHRQNQSMQVGNNIPDSGHCAVHSASVLRRDSIVKINEFERASRDLPSHVPTPETIEDEIVAVADNNEPWTNAAESAIDNALGHLANIFADNKRAKEDPQRPIRYAPSFETPPSSPATGRKKSSNTNGKSTSLPSSINNSGSTKWGPDYWNAKKISVSSLSPTGSVTSITSRLSNDSFNNCGGGSISVADIATQEQLLREAMNRKKKKKNSQQQQQNEKTVHAGDGVLGNANDNVGADEDEDSNSEKRLQQSNVNNNNNNNQIIAASAAERNCNHRAAKVVAARTATGLGVQATATTRNHHHHHHHHHPTASTAARSGQMEQKSVATALQLRWMYENALNLQAMSYYNGRRESLRLCDGEADEEQEEQYKENKDPGVVFSTINARSITIASRDMDDRDDGKEEGQEERELESTVRDESSPQLRALDQFQEKHSTQQQQQKQQHLSTAILA